METENQDMAGSGNTCLELALEGERLCKAGDFQGGVAFFEAAIQVGTDDLKTLSAIYSQLGNAYFYIGNYSKAMEFHKLDLTVARAISDRLGEAKASGNLGNSLKMMGRFDEAVLCCKRHLDISRDLGDKVGESRALYNLGNVYHTKGKHMAGIGHQDPGEFPEEVRLCLQNAVEYYEENLKLMTELGDRLAQGRAYGNLGNTHYLLGNFSQAISFHQERLKLAKEFGDKSAERRAYNNLGNAHIFLGEFESAANFFKKTLHLAEELGDRAVEAQACYSLGNTYTLLRDYPTAVEYHLRHLRIAQELRDKVGESRAYWSLGNAHSAMGSHETALQYANKHLAISKEIGDYSGQVTAQISISDLGKILGFSSTQGTPTSEKAFVTGGIPPTSNSGPNLNKLVSDGSPNRKNRFRRTSMENMDLLKMTPDSKDNNIRGENKENVNTQNSFLMPQNSTNEMELPSGSKTASSYSLNKNSISPLGNKKTSLSEGSQGGGGEEGDSFFDLLSRFQSERMDDQRCDVEALEGKDELPDLSSNVVGTSESRGSLRLGAAANISPCSSSNFLEAERASFERTREGSVSAESGKSGDDLFDLIAGMQSRRMDEQRASLPTLPGLAPQHTLENHNPSNAVVVVVNNSRQNSVRSVAAGPAISNPIQPPQLPVSSSYVEPLPISPSASEPSPIIPLDTSNPILQQARHSLISHRMSVDTSTPLPDDDFFDMLMRCQATRIEDQRSSMPNLGGVEANHLPQLSNNNENGIAATPNSVVATEGGSDETKNRLSGNNSTVPDDDFFNLILRFQGGRIEDQRSTLPSTKTGSLDRMGGSLRNTSTTRSGGGLLKSSLKHGILGNRMSK